MQGAGWGLGRRALASDVAFREVLIAVDTFHAEVATAAVAVGAHLVNDVSGGTLDPDMHRTVPPPLSLLPLPYPPTHTPDHHRLPSRTRTAESGAQATSGVVTHLGLWSSAGTCTCAPACLHGGAPAALGAPLAAPPLGAAAVAEALTRLHLVRSRPAPPFPPVSKGGGGAGGGGAAATGRHVAMVVEGGGEGG